MCRRIESPQKKRSVLIDTDTYQTPFLDFKDHQNGQQDGKWIVCDKILKDAFARCFCLLALNGAGGQTRLPTSLEVTPIMLRNGIEIANYRPADQARIAASPPHGLDMSSIDRRGDAQCLRRGAAQGRPITACA